MKPCEVCDDTGWVCENHRDVPWGGVSSRADACECGAGAACDVCNEHGGLERCAQNILCSVDGKSDVN